MKTHSLSDNAWRKSSRWIGAILLGLTLGGSHASASDHADPIDIFRREPLEPVITDLFVFPVDKYGKVVGLHRPKDGIPLHAFPGDYANPESGSAKYNADPSMSSTALRTELTAEQRSQIKSLVIIFCVRRALTESHKLNLEPYTYRIHLDSNSAITYAESSSPDGGAQPGMGYGGGNASEMKRPTITEARLRYGGSIDRPDKIKETVTMDFRLTNQAKLASFKATGLKSHEYSVTDQFIPDTISVYTDIRDDPFIFPAFFGTNVVAMVASIPLTSLPDGLNDLLIWGTTHKGSQQIDHVGRSLRTQNPRFELLNTRHPSEHVAALMDEQKNPSLMRDIFVRINLQQVFAYRNWDFVPDVMIYGLKYPVGYPNGRYVTDDVAAHLGQFGDTALLELSHNNAQWPRRTKNDKEFTETFPYLAAPWPDKTPAKPYELSARNRAIIGFAIVLVIVTVALAVLQVIHLVRTKLLGIRSPRKPLS